MKYIDCPICRINNTKQYWLFRSPQIVQCQQCGLIYKNPQPELSETRNYFESVYISDNQRLERELGKWRREMLERKARLIKARKPPGKILDVGCAGGDLLSILADMNWEGYGVEPSEIAFEAATRKGFQVYQGLLSDITFPQNNFFDVITYLDTLPFSATPGEDLETLSALLKPDGLLMIEIPGLAYRILRNVGPVSLIRYHRWSHLNSNSRHLFYYSTSTFAKLVQKYGFAIRRIEPEQVPMRNTKLFWLLNQMHYMGARGVMRLSLGRVNLGAKVCYVCTKV